MNHHRVPAADEIPSSVTVSRSSEHLQNFIALINESSSHDAFTLAKNIFSDLDTVREENKRLELEVTSSEKKYKALEENTRHTHTELIRSCHEVTEGEKRRRGELETRLSQTESLLEKEKKTTTDLKEANAELQQQNHGLVVQQQGENQKLTKAESRVAFLEGKTRLLEEKNEKQQESLKSQGLNITKLKSKLKDADNAAKEVQQDFNRVNSRLRQIEGFSYTLVQDEVAVDSAQFTTLWQECLRIVTVCFEEDLPATTLKNPAAWLALTDTPQHTHATFLPRSNSLAAKQMRVAVVLAIISSLMTDRIFAPSYLPEKDGSFSQILIDMAEKDPPKEQFLRGLMLSAIDEPMRADLATKKSRVVEDIVKLVTGLVTSRMTTLFTKEVRSIVDSAAEKWQACETRLSHFEVSGEGPHSWKWKTMQFSDTGIHLGDQTVNETDFQTDDKVLVVFPRVFTVDRDVDVPVFPGVVLQKSQTTAARQETVQIEASGESQGRGGSRRTPTSPRTAQPARVPQTPGGFFRLTKKWNLKGMFGRKS